MSQQQSSSLGSLLHQRGFQILLAVLVLHSVVYYGFLRPEPPVHAKALNEFPKEIAGWDMTGEFPVEPEVQEVLKADDTLNRTYNMPGVPQAGFFVAFFRSQQAGQAPHSPKNCLPGSGWEQLRSGTIKVKVDDRAEPIEVNRYLIARGDNKAMVLYWYQSHGRVVASEYWSKFYLVADSLRYRRSDAALVRVIVPIASDSDESKAEATATQFVRASFGRLAAILPS
jgi:EpsI family protein